MVKMTGYWPFLAFVDLVFHQFVSVQINAKLKKIFNNYSPKAKLILFNNILTVLSNMANDSLNLFVSSFVSFSINSLKENAENIFKLLPNSEKKSRALFVSVNSPWMRKFSLSLLANAVNSGYDQGERCLSPKFFALLTCWHVQFSKIFAFLFSP